MSDSHTPVLFTRHNLSLHALLLENQAWFCARDIGRLMGIHLSERMVKNWTRISAAFCGLSISGNPNSN